MTARFLLRFDDVCEAMAWSKFRDFDALMESLQITAVAGVVPDCGDPQLSVEQPQPDFWGKLRQLQARGWTIAQHGYTHVYCSSQSGVLGIGRRSEFAGLPFKAQFDKLNAGRNILLREGVWEPVFMAPSHSFDETTLCALQELGFRYISDGYGVYPYSIGGLTAVPQLFASPVHCGFGMFSICLHVNTMSAAARQRMLRFIRQNRRAFVSFDEAAAMSCGIPGVALAARVSTSATLRTARRLRSAFRAALCAA